MLCVNFLSFRFLQYPLYDFQILFKGPTGIEYGLVGSCSPVNQKGARQEKQYSYKASFRLYGKQIFIVKKMI